MHDFGNEIRMGYTSRLLVRCVGGGFRLMVSYAGDKSMLSIA